MSRELPQGTVTFLFTDVEGSTQLLHELGEESYADALAAHRRVIRAAAEQHGGVEVDTQGDSFLIAFSSAVGAIAAAEEIQRRLDGAIRVRAGLHTGVPHLTPEGYVGEDLHLGARIGAAGHGGQTLLSRATRELVDRDIAELGEHRLKDFAQPVEIFQLGTAGFPPLKTISNTNLPRPASTFIGREREIAAVAGLIRGGARLVTLTGPGGSGKTRLAVAAATELVPETKAGVFWVGLAAEREPALVVEAIARTLGAKTDVADLIGARNMLLLLDNFEQVVDAARDLSSLLEACPNLRVIVTSRELLRIRGEIEYSVSPLVADEAVALFVARSGCEPEHAVRDLCHRLDNLPLAIELAAARARVLSIAQINERLSRRLDFFQGGRDADPRQRTLRATIAWSFDLLTVGEQRLFERLGLFEGGCTLEAAESTADADVDTLQSLVEKSLVRRTGDRFWMLETIREFACEELGASDEMRVRHAAYYAELAHDAQPALSGTAPDDALDRLHVELPNLRQALEHFFADDPDAALQLAADLFRVWAIRGHLTEGAATLERALAADARPTRARTAALLAAAAMAGNSGDMARSEAHAAEALALAHEQADERGIAYGTYLLGVSHVERGNWLLARDLFADSLARFTTLGDRHYVLLAMDSLAYAYGGLGERARRIELHEEVLRQARECGDHAAMALSLSQLGGFRGDDGDYRGALELLRESLRVNRQLVRRPQVVEDVSRLARLCALAGRGREAAILVATAESMIAEMGGAMPWVPEHNAETRALVQAPGVMPLMPDDVYAFAEALSL
jgi:predicted ATPase